MNADDVAEIIDMMPDEIGSDDMMVLFLSIVKTYGYTGEQAASVFAQCIVLFMEEIMDQQDATRH